MEYGPGYENDLEGRFRWEMIADRDMDDCESNFLQSLINNKETVRINNLTTYQILTMIPM